MFKTILLAVSFAVLSAPAAFADGWTDNSGDASGAQTHASANTGATEGNTTFSTGSAAARDAGRGYVLENPNRSAFGSWRTPGESQKTNNQQLNLPPVVTAMPKRVEGVNTMYSGGSLALRNELGNNPDGLYLPPTHTNAISEDGFGRQTANFSKPTVVAPLLNVVTKPLPVPIPDAGF